MSKRNRQKEIVAVILIFAVILGVIYSFTGGGYGVFVSCEQSKVLGLKKVPPPQMSIIGSDTKCLVDLEVKSTEKTICMQNKFKVESKKLVVPCNGLEDFQGKKDLFIIANFYDQEGNKIGEDLQISANFW